MKIGESTNFTMAKLVREESSKSMGSLLTSIWEGSIACCKQKNLFKVTFWPQIFFDIYVSV